MTGALAPGRPARGASRSIERRALTISRDPRVQSPSAGSRRHGRPEEGERRVPSPVAPASPPRNNSVALQLAPSPKIAPIDRPDSPPPFPSRPLPTQESVSVAARQPTLAAATAAVSALVAANPALAGDLFGSEYSGLVGGFTIGIVGGTGAVAALLLPFICGTLNPVQMAVNLGLAEGEVSNERKFKNNGEPMEHGTKFGHKWYKTDAYCNGKYIDFAGTSKTQAAMEKGKL